jgi:hypothetical protein
MGQSDSLSIKRMDERKHFKQYSCSFRSYQSTPNGVSERFMIMERRVFLSKTAVHRSSLGCEGFLIPSDACLHAVSLTCQRAFPERESVKQGKSSTMSFLDILKREAFFRILFGIKHFFRSGGNLAYFCLIKTFLQVIFFRKRAKTGSSFSRFRCFAIPTFKRKLRTIFFK